jgi:hypothetical protein
MKCANATKFNRKSGVAEGSAVQSFRMAMNLSSRPERSEVEGPAVHPTSTQLTRKPLLFIGSAIELRFYIGTHPGVSQIHH